LVGPLGNQSIDNTYLRNYVNIDVHMIYGAGASASDLPPREVIVRNVRFAAVGMADRSDYGRQANIRMDGTVFAHSTTLTQSDRLFVYGYNGVAGDNFRVYYLEQAANIILQQSLMRWDGSVMLVQGSPEAGLTNQENWEKYHIALAGEVAPADAVAREGIIGLTKDI